MLPVLIVGGGPVGLALAGELGWRGIACTLVEQGDGRVAAPRMDMVSARTMEFCRRWGIAERVRQADYPRDRGQDIVYVDAVAGRRFGREAFASRAQQRPAPWSPESRERCPQHLFDPLLRAFAAGLPSVTLRHGVRLVSFEPRADHVRATLEDVGRGTRETRDVRWLAACDGASSAVRRALDIPSTGAGALTRSVNILFRLPGTAAHFDMGQVYRYMLFGRDGPWATLVAITGYDDWRLQVIDGGPQRWGDAQACDAVRRALGFEAPFELLSVSNWQRVEQVATRYRDGRVFLVGDAAHSLSPTGGFGMNTGIGDAVDLGWKLAAVLQGWAPDTLLDSYGAERQPVGARNAAVASANLARMRALVPPAGAFDDDAGRRAWGEVVSHTMRREWHSPGVLVGYRYVGSPVCVDDGDVSPDPEPWDQRCVVGGRAPHAWLSPGRSTLDWFGRGFVLVRAGAVAPGLADAAAARGVPFAEHDLPAAWWPLYGRRLTLVRPDGHVAWRSDDGPADPRWLIETVTGARVAAPAVTATDAARPRPTPGRPAPCETPTRGVPDADP